jgi:uncharacterized membrane protein YedE/YeeE
MSCRQWRKRSKREMTMETEFTPWLSLAGGVLIGLSAILLMMLNGRIAGMTGIHDRNYSADSPLTGPGVSPFLPEPLSAPMLFLAAGGEIAYAVPVSLPLLALGRSDCRRRRLLWRGLHVGAWCLRYGPIVAALDCRHRHLHDRDRASPSMSFATSQGA